MLQMTEEYHGKGQRGRMRRIRRHGAGSREAHGANGYMVFWIAMIATIVLLWYNIVSLIIAEGAP